MLLTDARAGKAASMDADSRKSHFVGMNPLSSRCLAIVGLFVGSTLTGTVAQEPTGDQVTESQEQYWISDEEFRVPISEKLAGEVEQLLDDLSSPQYAIREAATARLIDIGVPAFAQLRDAFRAANDLETRLRIERIVQDAYLASQVYDQNAFLGISQRPVRLDELGDHHLPKGSVGIKIAQVIEDTAAEEAGLQAEDVIIALDGQPFTPKTAQPTQEFGEAIRLRRPGTPLTLTILRNGRQLEVTAVLRARPRSYYDERQGFVAVMLAEAKQRFRIWWQMHFRDPEDVERTP
jgi:hypothetical protein